jgi:hypothetical protein
MKQALTGWVVQQCPGPGVQFGHTMYQVHGLAFCAICGGWATPSGAGSRGIRRPCPGYATKRGQELFRRVASVPPRLPDLHGRRAWPDGTPAGPPAALAAAGRKRRVAGVPSYTQPRSKAPVGVAGTGPSRPLLLFPVAGQSQAAARRAAIFARVRSREHSHPPAG